MTPRYTPPVRRVNAGKGHKYTDANGQRVPGVTTFLGDGMPKKALINWSAEATAEYAVDHWDQLGKLAPSARLNKLKKARYESRDTAGNRGTEVHCFAERYIAGEEVAIPDDIAGHVESYIAFVDDWTPEPILIEAVVMSHTHGYAGTLDLIADLPARGRCLIDLKTSRSGIFGETALQLACYRYADTYVDDQGAEQPMIPVDEVLGLHVRGDGYDLRPVEAERAQLREALYVREVGHFAEETSRTLVGQPLTPARAMKRRRLDVVEEVPA